MEQATKEEAYDAGYNCGEFGCNTDNCNYIYFATPELSKEWERGRSDALYPTPNPKTKAQVIRMATDIDGNLYVAE